MDVNSVIQSLLTSKWDATNVTTPVFRQLEFDATSPSLQILLEVFPARTTWVISGLYRVEHRCRITLYQKLIHYRPEDISGYNTLWFKVKDEIDRILRENKYNYTVTGINNIILGTWMDNIPSMRLGRGTKGIREPIVWISEQIIICTYYKDSGLTVS